MNSIKETKIPEIKKKYSSVEKEENKILVIIEHKKKNIYLHCDKEILLIINLIDGKSSIDDIRLELEKLGYDLSNETLNEIIFIKLKKLISDDEEENKYGYLFFKFTLINANLVKKISSYFSFIFRNKSFVIFTFIFFIFISIYLAFFTKNNFDITSQNIYVLPIILLFTLVFHEIGHAAACYTYGAKNGSIGFGFYLLTPVMFADVTDAWKLTKKERVLIDIAGLYMEGLLMCLLLIIYLLTKVDFFLYSSIIIVFNTFININPFLRFDGYWILSDITNTYNLRTISNNKLKDFISFRLKNISTRDFFLVFYAFLSLLFLFWFLFYMTYYRFIDLINFPKNIYLFLKGWILNHENSNIGFWQISLPLGFYLLIISKIKQLYFLVFNKIKS